MKDYRHKGTIQAVQADGDFKIGDQPFKSGDYLVNDHGDIKGMKKAEFEREFEPVGRVRVRGAAASGQPAATAPRKSGGSRKAAAEKNATAEKVTDAKPPTGEAQPHLPTG